MSDDKKPLEYFNRVNFNTLMDELLEKAADKYSRLLYKKRGWQMDDECKEEIRLYANDLFHKWMHHASLFAMYRAECENKEQLKKRKVHLDEADLELAWESLNNT